MTHFFTRLSWIHLCLCISLSLIVGTLQGQQLGEIKFSTIDKDNGLPANNISAIAKDGLGFLWIGTKNGLCRYESSNNVKNFYHKSDPNKLASSNIQVLKTDQQGNLWIGTRLGGLTRYRPTTEEWTTFMNDPNDPNSLSNNEVLAITEDRNGLLWIGTEDGLNIFDPQTEQFTIFKMDSRDSTALQSRAILHILEDQQGRMWIGTWAGGLHLATTAASGHLAEMKFRRFLPAQDLRSHNIWRIYQDRQQRFWLCTHGGGLFLMQLPPEATNSQVMQNWQPTFHNYLAQDHLTNSIASNIQQDIFQDQFDRLWVGTTNGISIIEPQHLPKSSYLYPTEDAPEIIFKQYQNDPAIPSSLGNNIIIDLYEDDQGIIWVGTFNGVSKYNWYNNQFKNSTHFTDEDDVPNSRNICVLPNREIWLASGNRGVIQYDLKNQKSTRYNQQNCHFLLDDFVSLIHNMDNQKVLFGSQSGLTIYDFLTQKVEKYPLSANLRKLHPNFQIKDIYLDDYQRIWLATGRGLFLLDLTTKEYQYFMNHPDDPQSISDNSINGMYKDSQGYLWITTYNGLNRVDIRQQRDEIFFETFQHNSAQPHNSLPSNRLTDVIEIEDKLYLGTSSGICFYDYETQQFGKLNHPDNNFFINSFEKTGNGELWASTTEAILRYNPQNESFSFFYKKNGLDDVTFRGLSSQKDIHGRLYFGNALGMVSVHPNQIAKNTAPPPVYVTQMKKINAQSGEEESSLINQKELKLTHHDYYVSFKFAALNYNSPHKNQYAYQLEGFDQDWNYVDNNYAATYTNLAPGEYTFRVKASNNDGVWNEEGNVLKIIRQPAFWETGWFYFAIFSLFSVGVLAAFKFYVYQIRQRNLRAKAKLKNLVNQRTEQLAEKNQQVESLLHKIKTRNEELEEIVSQRTARLQQSNRELQQSNQELEQFAYIASHDMKEPLRIVGNFSGLLKRRLKNADKSTQEYLYYIEDGAKRMTALINSLLTYSQLGKQGMKVERTNLNHILQIKLHDLSQVITRRKVEITYDELPEVKCEKDQIGMVFFNLINNGIKFNRSAKPTIKIAVHVDAPAGFWKFSVTDNGIGIEPAYQKKVFEIFRRLHNKQDYEGTGIGLALCQKIVQQHGGTISIDSVPNEYTTFYFTIAKNVDDQQAKEVVEEESLLIA